MIAAEGLKRSIKALISFIKEKTSEGSTFLNHAEFSILAERVDKEVIEAKRKGLTQSELGEIVREEKGETQKEQDEFFDLMMNSYLHSHQKKKQTKH